MTEAETETEGSARLPAPQAAVTSAKSSDPGYGQESFPVSTWDRLMESQVGGLWSLPLLLFTSPASLASCVSKLVVSTG